ncbi:hypothetical protein [Hyphomicrobium facile]|uniref:Uncharacterized protein n=1 Tax=Hyphomicrobium facile TaxID=51670 RepID=A0A1I7NRE0_9HYPH|nr:hypothetical protein [Hyphomicrobium facile]SFV37148.1 hypothetical protein SAMN04488557_3018 [Hyphomicrobium facile]
MSRSNSTSGQPAVEAQQVTDLPRPATSAPRRHLTLVVNRDWDLDPVPALAAIGPSTDF